MFGGWVQEADPRRLAAAERSRSPAPLTAQGQPPEARALPAPPTRPAPEPANEPAPGITHTDLAAEATELIALGAAGIEDLRAEESRRLERAHQEWLRKEQLCQRLQRVLLCYRSGNSIEEIWTGIARVVHQADLEIWTGIAADEGLRTPGPVSSNQ